MNIAARIFSALMLAAFVAALPAFAQDESATADAEAEPEVSIEPKPLPENVAIDFQERVDEIESQKRAIDDLQSRLDSVDGLMARVYASRMDEVWSSMFANTLSLARDVANRRNDGFEVSAAANILRRDLQVFPEEAMAIMERLSASVIFPTEDLPPAELVVLDQKLLRAVERYDAVLGSLVSYTKIAESMELDASEQIAFLLDRLPDAAANRSAYLQLTKSEVLIARAAAATLPTDLDLPARVLVAESRVKSASTGLQQIIALMDQMGLDSRQYRQQILTMTGEITTDVLDVGVVGGLAKEWSLTLYNLAKTEGPRLLFRLVLFALIIWIASRLGRLARRLATTGLNSSKVHMSHLLKAMIVSTVGNFVFLLGVLIALSQIGVSLGPLLAGLGIAGFIIGFALQDSLSNFASGMMILLYRPFDVGDFVEAGGVRGKVDRMSLVNTTFKTLDNQVLVVPNNLIWQTVITNLTGQRTRRVDLTFGISYDDDIDKAKEILIEVAENHEHVLKEPKPDVRVAALGESSVDLIVRPWVRTDHYWVTYWDLTELVKKRFDEEGITIPFPQRVMHRGAEA